jgi:hypothetical protein
LGNAAHALSRCREVRIRNKEERKKERKKKKGKKKERW